MLSNIINKHEKYNEEILYIMFYIFICFSFVLLFINGIINYFKRKYINYDKYEKLLESYNELYEIINEIKEEICILDNHF
jgi:hypothetical protein